jgi:hypothetical protein
LILDHTRCWTPHKEVARHAARASPTAASCALPYRLRPALRLSCFQGSPWCVDRMLRSALRHRGGIRDDHLMPRPRCARALADPICPTAGRTSRPDHRLTGHRRPRVHPSAGGTTNPTRRDAELLPSCCRATRRPDSGRGKVDLSRTFKPNHRTCGSVQNREAIRGIFFTESPRFRCPL